MKKHALLLISGGLLALGSCNNDSNNQPSQAQIDSAVNARVMAIEAELTAQNDSLINAMARAKADSIIAIRAGKTPPRPAVTTTTTKTNTGGGRTTRPVTPKPDKPKPNTNTGKADGTKGTNTGKIDGNNNNNGDTKGNNSTQGTNTGKRN